MAKSTHQIMLKFCIFMVLASLCCAGRQNMLEDEVKVDEFDVKPGGVEHTQETKWDGFVCKFTYICQGGTSEQWLVALTRNKQMTEYSCSVERHMGKSYLFFQEFSLTISGAQMEEVDLESEYGTNLKPSEYHVDYAANKVSQVNGEFQSALSKVGVFASKASEEL